MLGHQKLDGRAALVTGNIGPVTCATATALSRSGANVAIINTQSGASNQRDASGAWGLDSSVVVMALENGAPELCHAAFEKTRILLGNIDVLVNCADMLVAGPALETSALTWDRIFEVNLHHAFYFCQAFAQTIAQEQLSGRIINVSSVHSTHSTVGRAVYSAATAGLNSLTRSLAGEWAQYGIQVNAVAPLYAYTFDDEDNDDDEVSEGLELIARIPMGRLPEPDEIADLVLFLCTHEARFITGQTIFVDGGYTANGNW